MLKFVLTVAAGSAFYWVVASTLLPYSGVLLPRVTGLAPVWAFAVMHLANWTLLLFFSVPFAFLLAGALLSLRRPVLAGLLIATIGLAVPVAVQTDLPAWAGTGIRFSQAIDLAKFALTLPALTWLAEKWLPSNNSSKPTPLRGAA